MHRNWKELIQPNKLEATELNDSYGKFVIKPLERGYGLTLGNSLRRVLLASINGAAVTMIKIEGVEHEFSTINDIKEDVTDIVLNIKQVSIRYLGTDPKKVTIKAVGPCDVKAKDIITDGELEILNPEQHIATIDTNGKLDMELTVGHGRGYVSSDMNVVEDMPVGAIAIDSLFAPIRRVSYDVTQTRVGQMTDYDQLNIEIWTNGAVRPDDSIAYAAKILKEQLTVFVNFDETEEEVEVVDAKDFKPKLNENLFKTVDSLELSVRAANCLENADIKFIGELVTKSENDMLRTKNFGRKSLNEIKDILAEMGLSLGMKIDGFNPDELRTNSTI